ncbi:MAG TPA: DUF4350 domain-containing protein [Acidimicrobiales bacterium]|nr:DUF4350 domain-containing protein [Acidimicrobiales bacterium]
MRAATDSRSIWLVVVLVAVAALGGAVLVGRGARGRGGPPLDPRSTRESGTRGLVLLLKETGRDVSSGPVPSEPGDDVLVAFTGLIPPEQLEDLLDRARSGSTVALIGRSMPVADVRVVDRGTVEPEPGCPLGDLGRIRSLPQGSYSGVEIVDGNGSGCLPVAGGDGRLVYRGALGEGRLVLIGASEPFTNGSLKEDDNAALAVYSLGLVEGPLRFVVPSIGTGERTLTDLIDDPVWAGLFQALVAVVLYSLWRSRRLGRPVAETDPVEIDSGELVVAGARLAERARGRGVEIELMGRNLDDALRRRWGLSIRTDPAVVAERLGLDPERAAIVRRAQTRPQAGIDEDGFVSWVADVVEATRMVLDPRGAGAVPIPDPVTKSSSNQRSTE